MNRVLLNGRIGKEPMMYKTQNGNSCITFNVAVDRRYAGSDGERVTDWFTCVAWKNTAEIIGRYFGKGSRICLEGTLQNRTYTAQDGSKRTVTEVIVENFDFIDPKGDAAHTPTEERGFTEVDADELPF